MSEQTWTVVVTILGAVGTASSIVAVIVRVFIRSVVRDELDRFRRYYDAKFDAHLQQDHSQNGYYDKTRKPRLRFMEEEST